MPVTLSLKQAGFAAEYVARNGNGTRAAIAAGYSKKGASVAAVRLLRKDSVKKRIERLARRHEVTADRVLTRLDNLSMRAEEAGHWPTAVQAEIHLGKALGLFVERRENINIDLNGSHLDAIRALAVRRRNKSAGDAPILEGEATLSLDDSASDNLTHASTSQNVHYDKSSLNIKSHNINDLSHASSTGDVDAPSSGTSDADAHQV